MHVSDVIYNNLPALPLIYNTRDGKGVDIIVEINPKERKPAEIVGKCSFCNKGINGEGYNLKKVVSANFTDYNLLSSDKYVCKECEFCTNLYKYTYASSPDGFKLLNVREACKEIQKPQKPPFIFVVSTSGKKHLFYKAVVNYNPNLFTANLEDEKIQVNLELLQEQFKVIQNLQALGESKMAIAENKLRHVTLTTFKQPLLVWLERQQKTKQFKIVLHLAQKLDVDEETAKEEVLKWIS